MNNIIATIVFSLILGIVNAQTVDTFLLKFPKSKTGSTAYKRIIRYDPDDELYYVRDYYPNGQIEMEGAYSAFDKNVKEGMWCNYATNTKEGEFSTWYKNGQLLSRINFSNGLRHGLFEYWYPNGNKESVRNFKNGQDHGKVTYWDEEGNLLRELEFQNGTNLTPIDTGYRYISYTPVQYNNDTLKKWPLIIYLHGGSSRGTDTTKLFCCGIPDQIWRKRSFPFVIVAPQCPVNHRWSTDNWFEGFFEEVITKYRIDTNRVYLTGESLGGAGTWYLAIKYPEKFAAIAPVCGFTHHIEFIRENVENLVDMPIWAFHSQSDLLVQFEDTQWMVNKLKDRNKNLKFTTYPDAGHGIGWSVYPGEELYNWFLQFNKNTKN